MMEGSSVDPEPESYTRLQDDDVIQDAVPTTPSESLQSVNQSSHTPEGTAPSGAAGSGAVAPPLPQDHHDQQSTAHETRPQVLQCGASVCPDPEPLPECDQYLPNSKNKNVLPPEGRKPMVLDAVIIGHYKDREEIDCLKKRLNELMLYDNTPARVAVENDDADIGKGEITYFEQWLEKAQIMFILVTECFCKDCGSLFKLDVALVESFFMEYGKKEFVVPLFVDNKMSAKYMKPCLRAIKGINYFDFTWDDNVKRIFTRNLEAARKKIQMDY